MKLGLATRLTLLNAGIVALTCVGVVALMVTLTDGYMEAHVEESVIAELDVLVADYVIDGLKGVEGFIDIRQNFNAPSTVASIAWNLPTAGIWRGAGPNGPPAWTPTAA